ncbi:hypothetical protein Pmani_026698 [Petrolisthes manimaculis]|uniref:Uncharacterized protein n=1 Tax=Petrolisthes manimaculis TaxID=1843537 RepID=A0AAE1TX62_9EUCA|nr:hypothetical protein Pmani_026698 [Petrolisthes manimaculis]
MEGKEWASGGVRQGPGATVKNLDPARVRHRFQGQDKSGVAGGGGGEEGNVLVQTEWGDRHEVRFAAIVTKWLFVDVSKRLWGCGSVRGDGWGRSVGREGVLAGSEVKGSRRLDNTESFGSESEQRRRRWRCSWTTPLGILDTLSSPVLLPYLASSTRHTTFPF